MMDTIQSRVPGGIRSTRGGGVWKILQESSTTCTPGIGIIYYPGNYSYSKQTRRVGLYI